MASEDKCSEGYTYQDEVDLRVVLAHLRADIARQEAQVKVLQATFSEKQMALTEMHSFQNAGFACCSNQTELISRLEKHQELCKLELKEQLQKLESMKVKYKEKKCLLMELRESLPKSCNHSRHCSPCSGRSPRPGRSPTHRSTGSTSRCAISTKSLSSDSICSKKADPASPRLEVRITRSSPRRAPTVESISGKKKMANLQMATAHTFRRIKGVNFSLH